VKQLAQVMSEKNTVERMLEEMERKKEQIEAEKEAMRDANNELLDTVTVLKDARAADHVKHAITVRKWRNELVAYQEKTPTEFLAEILHLVSDMDNEVEIEIADAELAASRRGGGVRVAKAEELAIDDEWSHNPRLAMAEPDRLCRLASRTRAPLALGDGPAQVLAANESVDRGASGVEIKMTTPTQAAKRRAALGNISVNAAKSPAVKASAALKSPAAALPPRPSPPWTRASRRSSRRWPPRASRWRRSSTRRPLSGCWTCPRRPRTRSASGRDRAPSKCADLAPKRRP
jgi:hypothetical protein